MIIRPLHDYAKIRATDLSEEERDSVDALVYDMLNMSYKIKKLGIGIQKHHIQFTLQSNFVLQFIVDIETDSLLVMLWKGA